VPDHLPLPPPAPISSRRVRGGPPGPTRNPRRHGEGLAAELDRAVVKNREIQVVEGVDPALVFRVRAAGRVSEEDWRRRGLELLTEGEDWAYVVLSPGADAPPVGTELGRYAEAPDEEGATAPLSSFFAVLEAIEAYGPEDRLTNEVAEALDAEPGLVDIIVWPAGDPTEAASRVDQVVSAVKAVGGEVLRQDRRARSPVVRAPRAGCGA
jgi:hypothetical protein